MQVILKSQHYSVNGAFNMVSGVCELQAKDICERSNDSFSFNVSGANWKHVEGFIEGQTSTSCNKFENNHCAFAHPIDVHLACRGIQGWPKIHLEVYAVNALNQCWPVG